MIETEQIHFLGDVLLHKLKVESIFGNTEYTWRHK